MRVSTTVTAAACALLLTGLAGGTAGAADSGFTADPLPPGNGSLIGSIRPDGHTTWAFGMHFAPPGQGPTITPLLFSRDDAAPGSWRQVPLASFAGSSRINAAAAAPAARGDVRDAWLVGDRDASLGGVLTEHWDGTAWHLVTAPLPGDAVDGGLLSVSEDSPRDVWAAGWYQVDTTVQLPGGGTETDTHFEGLIEHWDGSTWHKVPLADPAAFVPNTLLARGPNDVWAGGYTDQDQPELRHFDGRTWKTAPLPATGLYGEVNQLAAAPDGTLWAVGRTLLDEEDRGHALVLRAAPGGGWRQVAAPETTGRLSALAVTPQGVTVVGATAPDDDTSVALRLTGTHWHDLNLPKPSDSPMYVVGLSAAPRTITVVGGSVPVGADDSVPLVLTRRD